MLPPFPKFCLSLFAATTLCVSAFGDTIVLKSGEKIEGTITKQNDTEVTVETKAGGIVDERVVKRADIANVAKEVPDEAPWQALRNLKLSDNSMPATQYDTYIAPLKAFVTQFPESKHKPEAEKMISDFDAEKQRVAAGERKLGGKWLSKEEVQKESYQINGAIALNFLREQASKGDLVGALNTFDLLEKQFPGSRSYIDAVEYVKRLLPNVKQQADARLARLPAETAEREKSLQLARAGEKGQVQAEMEREKKANADALALAKQQNRKWPPFLARNEEALKDISQKATEETRRLGEIDLSKQRESLRLAEEAKASLAKKDVDAAEESLKKAKDLWSENELLVRLDKDVSAAKETAAAEATAKAEAKPEEKTSAEGEKPPTGADGQQTAAQGDEDSSSSPIKRILIALAVAAAAYVGWQAYSNARKKSEQANR